MEFLSIRAEIEFPVTPARPAPTNPLLPIPAPPAAPVVPQVVVVAGETVGTVGTDKLGLWVPTMGNTPVVGTAGAELTPRLPISIAPSGIPVRAPPPRVVGDVDVGVDDEAMLLEPEPQLPDIPDVSIPEAVDISEVTGIPDGADIADDVDIDVADVAVVPVVAAVAGAAVPAAVPPPSKLAVDPNISDGEVPTVEHPLLAIAPPVGIAIVPVTPPVGAGLTPNDVISVEPRGMPVGETVEPVPRPNGEVAAMVGVGTAGLAIPLT